MDSTIAVDVIIHVATTAPTPNMKTTVDDTAFSVATVAGTLRHNPTALVLSHMTHAQCDDDVASEPIKTPTCSPLEGPPTYTCPIKPHKALP